MKNQLIELREKFTNDCDFGKEVAKLIKPKLEAGVWYDNKNVNCLVFRKGDDNNYGFHNGKFRNDLVCYTPGDWRLAPPETVKTALINEIKKRYKNGDVVKNLRNSQKVVFEENRLYSSYFDKNKLVGQAIFLFDNGKFAEVVVRKQSTIDFLIDLFTQTDNVIALKKMEKLNEILINNQNDLDLGAEVRKYLKG